MFSYNKALRDEDYTLFSTRLVSKVSEGETDDELESQYNTTTNLRRSSRRRRRRRGSYHSYHGSGCKFCGDRRLMNNDKLTAAGAGVVDPDAITRTALSFTHTKDIVSKWQESLKETLMSSRFDLFKSIEELTIEVGESFAF